MNETSPKARDIRLIEGIGDRLRSAAFAEIQALHAFERAAEVYQDAPRSLREAWRGLANAESRHLQWLLKRMEAIGQAVADRPVSDHLWYSFEICQDARSFSVFMAHAEERGRQAGERFCQLLQQIDPISSEIFGQIAKEEVEHIALAKRFFPDVETRA